MGAVEVRQTQIEEVWVMTNELFTGAFPTAIFGPFAKVRIDGTVPNSMSGDECFGRQQAPLTARSKLVNDGVDHVGEAGSAGESPFGAAQVGDDQAEDGTFV